jgi:hypothetical protein
MVVCMKTFAERLLNEKNGVFDNGSGFGEVFR